MTDHGSMDVNSLLIGRVRATALAIAKQSEIVNPSIRQSANPQSTIHNQQSSGFTC